MTEVIISPVSKPAPLETPSVEDITTPPSMLSLLAKFSGNSATLRPNQLKTVVLGLSCLGFLLFDATTEALFNSSTVPSALTTVGLPNAIDPEAFNLISGEERRKTRNKKFLNITSNI